MTPTSPVVLASDRMNVVRTMIVPANWLALAISVATLAPPFLAEKTPTAFLKIMLLGVDARVVSPKTLRENVFHNATDLSADTMLNVSFLSTDPLASVWKECSEMPILEGNALLSVALPQPLVYSQATFATTADVWRPVVPRPAASMPTVTKLTNLAVALMVSSETQR